MAFYHNQKFFRSIGLFLFGVGFVVIAINIVFSYSLIYANNLTHSYTKNYRISELITNSSKKVFYSVTGVMFLLILIASGIMYYHGAVIIPTLLIVTFGATALYGIKILRS